jgi:hypothetical protein
LSPSNNSLTLARQTSGCRTSNPYQLMIEPRAWLTKYDR